MKKALADYHLALSLTIEEREEIKQWRELNPHIKLNGEMARVILAYVRGHIPEHLIGREVRSLQKA